MSVTADIKDIISAKESTAYIISFIVVAFLSAFLFSKNFSIWE
jgi:hypothetical protein